ncbi:RpiB/LacA/LacB family sugar-phosphate isomerase [Streptomyces sp. MC1]|nr:RpiB/LacA/LacB family sugar-phosphate isomerase [Streptomyces sp. MC1]
MRLVIGSDEAGSHYKEALVRHLETSDLVAEVLDIGVHPRCPATYPEIAVAGARIVADGRADRALLICHTGLGVAIAANKVPGIRAVTAHDSLSVRASVCSNNAQVLAFGAGVIGLGLAQRLAGEWLTYRFDPHSTAAAKVAEITAFELQRGALAAAEGER